MQTFKITAWPEDQADWKDNPEWETIISAPLIGEAYAQGVAYFRTHCAEQGLEFEHFQVRANTP